MCISDWSSDVCSSDLGSSPAMYASMIGQMIDQVDRLQHLADVSVPTLVVVGEQDRPFVRPSQAMAAAVPGARLAVIPDAGHSPRFENPDRSEEHTSVLQ